MKIVYNAQSRGASDRTEEHLRKAMKELGHEVVDSGDGDIYLFHKDYKPPKEFTGKKVCWYFDKIWHGREKSISQMLDTVDLVFVTDETWTINNPHPKFRIMRQGIGDYELGKKLPYNKKIAFVGAVYRDRFQWLKELKTKYGDVGIYSSVFNRDLNNLCASIPIFVAPAYPSDDNYWSNRVYIITGSGGFLIHPRLKGLEEEYGDVLVYYDNDTDLYEKIDYYLKHPKKRKEKQKEMYEFTKEHFTYKKRIETLLNSL